MGWRRRREQQRGVGSLCEDVAPSHCGDLTAGLAGPHPAILMQGRGGAAAKRTKEERPGRGRG